VSALFFNFHPAMVARSVPDVWSFAQPPELLRVRRAAAAEALRLRIPSVESLAASVEPLLDRVVEGANGSGRALFSANRQLGRPHDPVEALWQACTSLREHRGDGHVALLTASGLDGCEALALFAAAEELDPEGLRQNRGWAPEEWGAAVERLSGRGWLAGGGLTPAGAEGRQQIEEGTDRLAGAPYRILGPDDSRRLAEQLGPAVAALLATGTIPFPNPIGLPPPAGPG
jgi:hypothetical protein